MAVVEVGVWGMERPISAFTLSAFITSTEVPLNPEDLTEHSVGPLI